MLDKSSIQSLSDNEITFLYKYYFLNLTPVLIVEILGDLTKPSKDSQDAEKKVMHLAKKLKQVDSAVNIYYRELIYDSLSGYQIAMDHRPIIGGSSLVIDNNGKTGEFIEESPEEKSLSRWSNRVFDKTEESLSQQWRRISQSFNLNELKENYKVISDKIACTRSLSELNKEIDKLLGNPNLQEQLLSLLIKELRINDNLIDEIFQRWKKNKNMMLKNFAPYAFYCFKTNLLFYIGLYRNCIGTKPTNRIDLEYIYYLPFTTIFSSNDKFHESFCPFFMKKNQEFISGIKLKEDLMIINEKWNSLSDEKKRKSPEEYDPFPPDNTLTAKLWEKCPYIKKQKEVNNSSFSDLTAEGLFEKLKKLERIKRADEFSDREPGYVVRKRTISSDDPCPCGSGKKFKDCHLNKIGNGDGQQNKSWGGTRRYFYAKNV